MNAIYKIPQLSALTGAILAGVSHLKADVPAAILGAVTNSDQYSLIYEASIPEVAPAWGNGADYVIDNSATGPASFDRVAYIMELDDTWVWVSFDTLTEANTLGKIGVPTVPVVDGTPIQTRVANMDVFSSITDANVIATGTGLTTGNIEFWPGNFNESNAINIPNADAGVFDWGDGGASASVGYGSMQIHNHGASQVIFGFNRWGGGGEGGTDIGIGNNMFGNVDYVFAENGSNFTMRNLYVLVREGTPMFPAPEATGAAASVNGDKISLKFDEEISDDSVDVANFSIQGGPAITAADASGNNVILTTSGLVAGTAYTVNYTGVAGVPGGGQPLTDTLTVEVTPPALPALPGTIPAANGYELIYQAEIPEFAPAWANGASYLVDESSFAEATTFDRVAYLMELDDTWVFVSFETLPQAQTLATVGIPTVDVVNGTPIQTRITNMDVFSSITDANIIATGTGLAGGNIEFWPGNYNGTNALDIPNASTAAFDWGDGGAATNVGYGSMQVHNHDASQVIFAFNRWGNGGGGTDIGIGNNTDGNADYTFSESGLNFTKRNLYVLVRPGTPMFLSPEATGALASLVGNQILLTFSEEIDGSSVDVANFSIEGGPVLTAAKSSGNTVVLSTSGLVAGTTYTVNYTGVAGLPGAGVALAETLTVEFTSPTVPTLPGTIPAAAGYELIYHAEIPEAAPAWGEGVSYLIDQSSFSDTTNFDRVAYIMELGGEWVFVSFDVLQQASRLSKIGVPTVDVVNGTPIQTTVSKMDVSSSIAGITQGTGLSGGNIEFWPGNYNGANDANIPNANPDTFDFGDGGANPGTGYGSMQIHNHDASEVLFAFNRWGSGFAGTSDVGIGTNTVEGQNPDYTFAENAAGFASRNLYVLVRPSSSEIPQAIANAVSESNGYDLVYQLDIPAVNEFSGDAQTISEAYIVDNSATVEAGSRVAYLLVLDDEWVWVSFDAVTDDLSKIGIPHVDAWPTALQQIVTNMSVFSNAPQITAGDFAEGNIEFWGGNYSQGNALAIGNADDGLFDFGDTMSGGGHGSMQVHNFMESQVVFAYNNWGSNNPGQSGGLGIGNNPGGEPDWTFSGSSDTYALPTLYVLTGEAFNIPLQITSISPNLSTNQVALTWTSSVGETFILSWSDDLEVFNEVEDGIVGGDGSTSFVDFVPPGTTKRFYQVTKE